MTIYVMGHRNPDTDSICAALGYADFLRKTRCPDALAARCGDLNPKTQGVLNRAGVEPPRLMLDVRPTAGRICHRQVITARSDEAFYDVYRRMQKHQLRALPVLNPEGKLAGMLSMSSLLELLLPDGLMVGNTRVVETSLEQIGRVLGGKFLHAANPDRVEALYLTVGAMSSANFVPRLKEIPAQQSLIVAGDRPTIQRPAIEYGVRCIVLSGACQLGDDLLTLAQEKGVCVLVSPWDTATTTLMIRGAKVIWDAVDTQFLKFREHLLARAILREIQSNPQTLFPVVRENGGLLGVFSRTDLIDPKPIRLILVDHNELGQAVTGAEEAEILEVIDHHRIGGGLISREPIRFLNEIVGSTCTLITRLYRQEALTPDPALGQCLAAGIVSDTLNLRSPTATAMDGQMLDWLSQCCGIDLTLFAEEFFAEGSALQSYSAADALRMDCKDYSEGPWRFSVAQVEEVGFDHFELQKQALLHALEAMCSDRGLDFACLLVTDIQQNDSLLLTAGDERLIEVMDYPPLESRVFSLQGVVSRKKQLLPHLSRLMARVEKL